MNPIMPQKQACSFAHQRRWLGGLFVLAAMAASAFGASYTNKVYIGIAPPGYITNTSPTNLTANVTNIIVDTVGYGVDISLEARSSISNAVFSHWSGSLAGLLANSNNPAIIGLTLFNTNGDLIANLVPRVSLKVAADNPLNGNTIPASGTITNVPLGKAITVQAVETKVNYEFYFWKVVAGDVTISDTNSATTLVTVNSIGVQAEVQAVFRQKRALTIGFTGSGYAYANTNRASATSTFYFSPGELVLLSAVGTAGETFVKWMSNVGDSVADPLSANTSITLNNDSVISVEFATAYTLVVLAKPNGMVEMENGTLVTGYTNSVKKDTMVKITAVPTNGYAFKEWKTVGGGAIDPLPSTNSSITFKMDHAYSFVAYFTPVYTVTVYENRMSAIPDLVSVKGGQPWMIQDTNRVMESGALIRYYLNGWKLGTGDVSPASGLGTAVSVSMASQDSSFTWDWQLQYFLTAQATPGGNVSYYGGWKPAGSTATITATAEPDYFLTGWQVNDVLQLTALYSLTVTMNEPKVVVAIFSRFGLDKDGDGMPDTWEISYGLDETNPNGEDGGLGDPDRDGLSNLMEYQMAMTNMPGQPPLFMNPINADTDGDGMDDLFEATKITPTNGPEAGVSAAMSSQGAFGPEGNMDGDFKWDTATGYQLPNQPLRNIDEWRGPDGVDPCTYVTVPWDSVFATNTPYRQSVKQRFPPNPLHPLPYTYSGSNDQSDPSDTDTDNDGFDDGYEFSWDKWHQANQGKSIDPMTNWPAITGVVPPWPAGRRYNPNEPLEITPFTLDPDFDWLYRVDRGSVSRPYDDLTEYQASTLTSTSAYPVVRLFQRPEPWSTNPFLWDTDGDGLPDGWEMTFGYDPWARDTDNNGRSDAFENPDGDAIAENGNLYHREVYATNGFNPGLAWYDDPEKPKSAFNNILEFIGSAAIGSGGYSNATPDWLVNTVNHISTNPRNIDTDFDGMFDGWEFYLGFNPQVAADAGENPDKPTDTLVNWQEFMCSSVINVWQQLIAAGRTPDAIQPVWLAFSQSWPNKTLPTDPFNDDTDHDQLYDSEEQSAFNYGTTGAAGAGGGLNPDTVDTDLDYLPDAWELYSAGVLTNAVDTNGVSVIVWTDGMDGTVYDALLDYDGDGLYNYQEYMVGACYQFQWLFNDGSETLGDPIGSNYDPYDFFDVNLSGNDAFVGPGALRGHVWDPAYWSDRMYPVDARTKPFTFMSGNHSAFEGQVIFSTCNPGDADTDRDGFDDYFELYHNLNPIRGSYDRVLGKLMGVPEAWDISFLYDATYDLPFKWGEVSSEGTPVEDFDQDGQVDVQENITVNLPAVQSYTHTDPSPYFVSDLSSDSSYINLFYKTGNTFGGRMYWYWDDAVLMDMAYPAAYLFSFEMNEGYDTDNDLVADSVEVVGTSPGATDPLDDDSPLRQRALFVNGTDAAARLFAPEFNNWSSFRAFTVEAWVKPVSLDGDRVIVERAGMVKPGNPGSTTTPRVTRNFRLGIKDGIPYVSFDGFGVNWEIVSVVSTNRAKVIANQWTHLAGVYDPTIKQLLLYVNGEIAGSKTTEQIPFNGFIAGNPNNGVLSAYGMMVTVGAADENPNAYCDGTRDDIKSGPPYWGFPYSLSFPVLTNYYHGWIDEVHLWDGIRSANQIRALYGQKMTRNLINSINGVQTGNQTFHGDLGGSELNPKMIYAFTFDGLPSPTEGVLPLGFGDAVQVPGWTDIRWWSLFPYHSTVYNDYRYVKWIQNMASHQPFDPPRDTRMTRWIVDGKTQNFPNTSNPYAMEYTHGLGGRWEYHPQYGPTMAVVFLGLADPSTNRPYGGVYGDLLPLGGARGDDDLLMWDGSLPTDLTRDQDGDGLPDIWEETNGLDPLDPLDADGDEDRDGLSNIKEYAIGSNPYGSFSLSENIPDFFAYTNGIPGPYRFLGEEWTDMDYMEDLWESAYGLNTEMYDAMGPGADLDNDGWSNLAEFQELANLRAVGTGLAPVATNLFPAFTPLADNDYYKSLLGDLNFLQNQDTNSAVTWQLQWNDPNDERFHPIPKLIFRFQYAGKSRTLANPRFVVLAYTDRIMDVPDASIRGTGDRTDTYPRYMALNQEQANSFSYEGTIREGINWFWGFMDLNNDGRYQANEPGGFAGPVTVRWGSVGPIDIPLTDIRPNGFARFSWTPDPLAESYQVIIVDKNTLGSPQVFNRTFSPSRTFVHEGDLRYNPKSANGLKLSGGYQWYVRSVYDNLLHDVANGMAYVKYTIPMPAPTLIWPVGNARLRQSRDTFIWKMDPTVTFCNLKVRRRETGALVLNYGFIPPARNLYGRYQMQMPIYIGDGVFQNGVYDYTLTVRNRAGAAAATSQFTVRIGDYPGYSYSLSGVFIYPGKVTNGNFVVEAYTSPGFGGVPAGRRIVPNTITSSAWPTNLFSFTIRGLPAGWYYVKAFLNQNGSYPNYVADDFESQGWHTRNFYWPEPVQVADNGTATVNGWIKVLMRDLDSDRIPDDWEYMWNKNLTAFGLGNLRGYVPALNGVLNVFECYGYAPLGVNPK